MGLKYKGFKVFKDISDVKQEITKLYLFFHTHRTKKFCCLVHELIFPASHVHIRRMVEKQG